MFNLRQQAKESRAALTEAYQEAGGKDFSRLTRATYEIVGLLDKYENHKNKFRDNLNDQELYQLWYAETFIASRLDEGATLDEAISALKTEL